MKEQAPYNITSDQGWSKLRPSLDEAMPVNRPARRFAFLWWSTSAVLMSGMLGLFFYKGVDLFTQPVLTTHPKVEATPFIDALQQPVQHEIMDNSIKVNDVQSTPSTIIPNPKSSNSIQDIKANRTETIKPVSPPKNSKKVIQTEPIASSLGHPPIAEHSIGEMKVSEMEVPTLEAARVAESVDSKSTAPAVTLRNQPVIESLPGLYSSSIEVSEREDIMSTGAVRKMKSSPHFIEPSVALSGLIGANDGLGATASVGLDVNVSRRFNITTSLGFMNYSPGANFLGGPKDFSSGTPFNPVLNYDPTYSNEGIYTYVDGNSFNSSAGYNAINPLVENLTQWQVNGGVKFKISPRLYTEAGGTIGFGTTAYSAYPIVNEDPNSTVLNVKIGKSLETYDVIRSTMTSVYAGMGYRLGKHFDVFANWTHGFDNYILSESAGGQFVDIDSGDRTDYIRGLNVGMRYTL